jgi:hypothetical protein
MMEVMWIWVRQERIAFMVAVADKDEYCNQDVIGIDSAPHSTD